VVRHTHVLEQLQNTRFGQLSNANPLDVGSCVTVVASRIQPNDNNRGPRLSPHVP
jgi:hypothetical protein